MTTLAELSPGQRAEIVSLSGAPALVQRFYEFGLLEGEQVEVIARALLGDPIEIGLGSSRLSLRKSEAAGIGVRLL
ncbi:MAG TPA: ferrous iron transport protein A [Gemmata sp.]